jgi:hypothetical protein
MYSKAIASIAITILVALKIIFYSCYSMGKRTPARALNESLGIIAVNAKKIMWKCFRSAQLARYESREGAQLAKNDDALVLKDGGACVAGKRTPTDSL